VGRVRNFLAIQSDFSGCARLLREVFRGSEIPARAHRKSMSAGRVVHPLPCERSLLLTSRMVAEVRQVDRIEREATRVEVGRIEGLFPKVEIRMPVQVCSGDISKKLWLAFTSCGFDCEVVRSLSSPARGVVIEAHPDSKRAIGTIEEAFATAGIKTFQARSSALPLSHVIIHVGKRENF
jgi:hypothetical protein